MVIKLPPGSFFGQTQSRRVLEGITVLESVYSHDLRIPPHAHAEAFFDLVLDGACSEVHDGQTTDRSRSACAFHPPGEVHSNSWHGPEPRCFHIAIAPALLNRVGQYAPLLTRSVHFPAGTPGLLATRVYHEFRRMDEVSPLVIEGLTLELLAQTTRLASRIPERRPPRWLRRVRELLHDKFSERLTLEVLAESAGVHPAHLARVFRQFLGCTVGDYLRQLRIECACRRLTSSDASLVEIALAAGFADQSHFSRTFKRHTGLSPVAFQKSFGRRKADAKECSPGARP
jgi:AraC family transcriptional regulator